MKHVFEKSLGMKSWSDKISAFLKGPGWFPGTERLGDLSMVPEVQAHTSTSLQLQLVYSWRLSKNLMKKLKQVNFP